MEEKKVYRLLKDLPDCKAGTLYCFHKASHIYAPENFCYFGQYPCFSENNFKKYIGEWFELVTPERIEVKNITQWNMTDVINGGRYLKVDISDYLPPDKLPLIKQAIEQVLNDEVGILGLTVLSPNQPKYTEKDLLEAEEKAFDAGRFYDGHPISNYRYKNFSDYKNQTNAQ